VFFYFFCDEISYYHLLYFVVVQIMEESASDCDLVAASAEDLVCFSILIVLEITHTQISWA
jgi:hypothetical protein